MKVLFKFIQCTALITERTDDLYACAAEWATSHKYPVPEAISRMFEQLCGSACDSLQISMLDDSAIDIVFDHWLKNLKSGVQSEYVV